MPKDTKDFDNDTDPRFQREILNETAKEGSTEEIRKAAERAAERLNNKKD